MFARNAWYMAGWSRELERAPLSRSLLGSPVALYRDAQGVAHALAGVCPHRGSDLGKGRVVDGVLECPFHGWRFGADGRCLRIPSQPDTHPVPMRARTAHYPLREQQGILWIWLGEARESLPRPPWHSFWEPGPRVRRSHHQARLVAAPFLSVVETALDNSHLGFVHRHSLPGHPTLIQKQQIEIDEDRRGFRGVDDPDSSWKPLPPDPRSRGSALSWLLRGVGFRPPREYFYRLELPALVFHHTSYDDGTWDVVVANATPAGERQTWFFSELVRTRAPHLLGEAAQRLFHRRLADEDEQAWKNLSALGGGGLEQPIHVAADHAAVVFRNLYARLARAEAVMVPWDFGDDDEKPAAGSGEPG